MADTMTVNLGKARGASRANKAGKAIQELKRQVEQRAGYSDVRISNTLNERIWARGARRPPRTVDVQLVEIEDYVLVEAADVDREAAVEREPAAEEIEEDIEEELEEAMEEAAAEEFAEEEEQEAGEVEEEAEPEEEEETYDLSDEIRDVLKEGTIPEAKEAVKSLNKADFEKLLNFEEKHQNRKGMKKFLRSNMR